METVTGRCGAVADGRLTVQTQNAARDIELAEVRGLSVRKSRIAETTVLLGLTGAAIGAANYVEGSSCVLDLCPRNRFIRERGRGAGVGAIVGAAAGLLVGSRIKYWQQRYP